MINSVKFLEQKLKELFLQFPKSNIRYEFRSNRNSHLVEITPLSFYVNEKYKIAETKIEDEFENLYPNENILFISENSLNKISNANFELISEFKGAICLLGEVSSLPAYNFINIFPEYAGENNYALAA
ncbi:hypothetical protein [Flavobacterium sp.]|uniref:hypothetical protein n=1 Tax=Flavobacterium sp. TaxID=239 RepID=UPI00391D1DCE